MEIIPTIEITFHHLQLDKPMVEIGWNVPERKPNPTKFEMDRCPPSFRCYSCLEKKGRKKHFGGEVLSKRICRTCYPYCDEPTVGAIIRFDRIHGFEYLA